MNISVEPMYYIQDMHSLGGFSQNGLGTTCSLCRSVDERERRAQPGTLTTARAIVSFASIHDIEIPENDQEHR